MRSEIRLASLVVAVLESFFCGGTSAQICPANIPHLTGTWTVLPYHMPINPVSASLLPDGTVGIVAGSENDKTNNSEGAESYRAAIWDPTRTTERRIAIQNLTYDVFCSGTAALPDGRSLIVGGTSDYTFKGENRAYCLRPCDAPIHAIAEHGRRSLVRHGDHSRRWTNHGHVRAQAKRRRQSDRGDLRSQQRRRRMERTDQCAVSARPCTRA